MDALISNCPHHSFNPKCPELASARELSSTLSGNSSSLIHLLVQAIDLRILGLGATLAHPALQHHRFSFTKASRTLQTTPARQRQSPAAETSWGVRRWLQVLAAKCSGRRINVPALAVQHVEWKLKMRFCVEACFIEDLCKESWGLLGYGLGQRISTCLCGHDDCPGGTCSDVIYKCCLI